MSRSALLRADSPWLWAGLFALVGAAGLFVIAPKYSDRKERLETQFEGRRKAMQQTSDNALSKATADQVPLRTEMSANSGLWLLGAVVGGTVLLAGFALYVFRGGYLRPARRITVQQEQTSKEDLSESSEDSRQQQEIG